MIKMSKPIKRSISIRADNSGFSLIEIVVVLAIFSTVLVAATSMFQSVIVSSRNNTASLGVVESLRYSLEIMAKEMRNSSYAIGEGTQDCTKETPDDNKYVYNLISAGSPRIDNGPGQSLKFKNKYGQCVHYYLENNTVKAEKGDGKATTTSQFLPDNVLVENLQFYMVGTSTAPSVTMVMDVKTKEKRAGDQKIKIQTTITTRNYEIY